MSAMDTPFVKIPIHLLREPVMRKPHTRFVFLELLARARWATTRYRFNGQEVQLERGQCATSIRSMAALCGLTEKLVRSAFRALKRAGLCTFSVGTPSGTPSGTPPTVVSFNNFNDFCGLGAEAGTPSGTPPGTHKQERESEIKKDKIQTPSESGPEHPPSGSMPDMKTQFWRECRRYLGPHRASKVGQWVSKYGLGLCFEALVACQRENPGDRVSYIEGILQRLVGKRGTELSSAASVARILEKHARGEEVGLMPDGYKSQNSNFVTPRMLELGKDNMFRRNV